MIIKVLGSGCANCKRLYNNSVLAAEELGIETEVIYVKDFAEISKYNAMHMPALVVDEKLVSQGRVLTKEQIIEILK